MPSCSAIYFNLFIISYALIGANLKIAHLDCIGSIILEEQLHDNINEDVYVDEKYWEVISSNEDRIIKEINAECDLHKDEIISLVKKIIRRYFGDGMPDHYEWRDDGCTYDISGYIVKTDKVNSNTTIKDFLENEYTGDREPTYESGMGFYHTRYCDGLDDNSEIRSFIYELAYNVLKRILLEGIILKMI